MFSVDKFLGKLGGGTSTTIIEGSQLHVGMTDPTPAQGNNGDSFINKATKVLFAPKTSGQWPNGIDLSGTEMLFGTTDPKDSDGSDGAVYFNETTKTLFGPKANGKWGAGSSLTGEPGGQGPAGPKGDKGDQGLKGDVGPTGPAGPKGETGLTGAQGLKGDVGPVGPQGIKGDTGSQGPKGDAGSTGPAGPKGDKGETGATGPKGDTGAQGLQGVGLAPGTAIQQASLALETAYRATDLTKPHFLSVMIDVTYTVTLASTMSDTVELWVGPDATGVATGGTTAKRVASFRSALTGIAVSIGMAAGDRGQLTWLVPAGHYFALRRTAGTRATIAEAFLQPLT